MKYLGIDYGTKKIGIAISDETGSVAFPLTTLSAGVDVLSHVHTLIEENNVREVVIGESRNFKGEANEVMEDIEQFKKDLEELTKLSVTYEQEFMSSAMAARQYTPDGSRKENPSQEKIDAAAAALILQSYLDRNKKTG